MSIQTTGGGVIHCPCPGCGKVIDYTLLHPSSPVPHKTRTLCRNLHPVELEFIEYGKEPTVRCLLQSPK